MKAEHLIGGAISLSLGSALLCLLGLVALNTGATIGVPPVALGLTQGYEAAAYGRLVRSSSARELRDAQVYAEAALKLSPYANTARLRLVYIDTVRNGHLTVEGARHFVRSYELMPIDPDVAAWRVRFGLENWEDLPSAARISVHDEAMAFWRLGSRDVDMPIVLSTIQNPAGRLAVALWLRSLMSTPPVGCLRTEHSRRYTDECELLIEDSTSSTA